MEHKTLSFEIKTVDYTGRTLEGFAAAFGNIDQVGDIIHPGAFRKTLQERGQRIKFLWQHDPTEPIGKLLEAHEQPGGLFVKAIISDTQRGRDALALLKDGAIGEMSIGYDTIKGGMDYTKGTNGNTIRNLREVKLYEFSLVTFPANEQAVVTGVKEQPEELSDVYRKVGTLMGYADIRNDDNTGGYLIPEPYANELVKALEAGRKLTAETVLEHPDTKGGDPTSSVKAGRTISRATLAKLKAARDVIDELCAMGIIPDESEEEDEEEKPLDKENKSAKIISSQVDEPSDTNQTTEYAAGPVRPPTEKLLKLIDLELSELHFTEVTQ